MNDSAGIRTLRWLSIIMNSLIIVFTAYSILGFYFVGGDGNMAVTGSRCFVYFTVDSNVLAAIAAALIIIAQAAGMSSGKTIPGGIIVLKHVGTVAIAVTFFTVIGFLGPLFGFQYMYVGSSFFMHLITPLLAMLSLCCTECRPPMRFRVTFLGMIPTAVYGAVYMIMVVFRREWHDFYGFNMGGRWYVSLVVMLTVTWLLSLGLWAVRNARRKKNLPVIRSA